MIAILGAVNAAVRHARGRHSWAGSEAEAESGAGLPVKSAVFARAVGGWGEVEVIGERCEEDSAYGKRQLLAEAGDPGHAQRRVFTARRSALAEEAVGVKLLGIFKDVAAVMALAHADSHKPYEVASANRLPRLPDEVFALLEPKCFAHDPPRNLARLGVIPQFLDPLRMIADHLYHPVHQSGYVRRCDQ
ncbi:MAG: hypothetical protein WAK39_21105 [Pseudolabrys sp.]